MSCNTCELPPFHSQYLLQQEILSPTTSSSHPGWVPCAVLISSCWTCLTFSESIYITCQKAAGTVSSHLHGTQLCRDRGHDFYNRKIVFSLQRKKQQKTFMLKGKPKQGVVADVRQWYTHRGIVLLRALQWWEYCREPACQEPQMGTLRAPVQSHTLRAAFPPLHFTCQGEMCPGQS